jgi:hypothetical protein
VEDVQQDVYLEKEENQFVDQNAYHVNHAEHVEDQENLEEELLLVDLQDFHNKRTLAN